MHHRASRELARQWDMRDPLARFRKQFYRPTGQIYLDGNSLGLCSQDAERALLGVIADWKTKASNGWNGAASPWSSSGEKLATRLARLVGAAPDEVAIANSPITNLHQLLATIYRRQFHRPRILIDSLCFPAEREAIRSHLELRDVDAETQLLVVEPGDGRLLDEAELEAAMADPTLQMAVLPAVVYATGQLLDLPRLCRTARHCGVIIGLNLSHSLGVMPHALDEWDADFAFWGHGQSTNGGPGAAGGLYLNRRHFGEAMGVKPGLAGGWSGSEERAGDLFSETHLSRGAAKLQIGPPPILSMAPLDGALRPLEEAGLERVRTKSLHLTQFLRSAIESEIPALDCVTPKEPERRGGHLSLRHSSARAIYQALRPSGVSADFCEPDLICLAPAPLYNSFVECWDAVQILRRVVEMQTGQRLADEPELVS